MAFMTTVRESEMTKEKTQFFFPRDVLVIEIDRRCAQDQCRQRNQISLTKAEAFEYRGFNCSECECWNDDRLSQSEMPESWDEASIH
jgi:hypothetical protein